MSPVSLKTYTSEKLTVLGECEVTVEYNGQTKLLPIAIVSGDGPSLLGRNWLEQLHLDWHRIANLSRNDQLEDLLTEYHEISKDELGTVRNRQATSHLKEGATPKFFRSRSIPFAIKEAVGGELDQLEAAGIIEKVSHAEWAAPIVAVPKKNGRFRICGDYKVTINPVLETEQYPLPKPEELFATLAGGMKFTKLDLTQAYTQVLLDNTSAGYVSINTTRAYTNKRLPYGVASFPGDS